MTSLRRPLSRFLYRTLYALIYVVTLALLLITPADSIDQALRAPREHQYYIIWVVAVCCILTVAILTFVYALRLYGNGSALASIPKGWVPVAESDVGEKVHKVIDSGLERSAQIAWKARPRVAGNDGPFGPRGGASAPHGVAIQLPPQRPSPPVWGDVEHDGWTSPNSTSWLPALLSYDSVISELPALVEAKALTLAPQVPSPSSPSSSSSSSSPSSSSSSASASAFFRFPHNQQPPVDAAAAAAVLQRPPYQSFRDYIYRLAGLGVISLDSTANSFLSLYEYARFSTRPVSGDRFRELMHLFGEMLTCMRNPDAAKITSAFEEQFGGASYDGGSSFDDGDIDDDAPASHGSPSTPRSANRSGHDNVMFPTGLGHPRALGMRSSLANTWHTRHHHHHHHHHHHNLHNLHQLRTALGTSKDESPAPPATPMPMPRMRTARTAPLPLTSSSPVASSPSSRFFARSRKPYSASQYSGMSAKSATSAKSSSALSRSGSIAQSFLTHRSGSYGRSGSVIRLAMDGEDTAGLPFVITGSGA